MFNTAQYELNFFTQVENNLQKQIKSLYRSKSCSKVNTLWTKIDSPNLQEIDKKENGKFLVKAEKKESLELKILMHKK